MSTVRYFRWDDAGAPSLSGQVGSLTNLLRKCLVGVGGVAYGAQASAGWSELFIGAAANIAVFTNNQGEGGSGCCVLVNDAAPGAGGARESRLTCYMAMTDIATGTGASSTAFVRKSATLDGTARKWLVIADGLTAYLYVWGTGDIATDQRDHSTAGFGDYASFTNTSYRYFCMGRSVENTALGYIAAFSIHDTAMHSGSVGFSGLSPDGLGTSAAFLISHPFYVSPGPSTVGGSNAPSPPYLSIPDHRFMRDPMIRIGASPIGRLRGLLLPITYISTNPGGAEFPGLPGQIVIQVRATIPTNSTNAGAFLCDAVGPW